MYARRCHKGKPHGLACSRRVCPCRVVADAVCINVALLTIAACCMLPRLDLPWWEKLAGATFKNWRFQLRQLSGGKQDDITVIVSKVIIQPALESGEGKPQDEAGAMAAMPAGSAEDLGFRFEALQGLHIGARLPPLLERHPLFLSFCGSLLCRSFPCFRPPPVLVAPCNPLCLSGGP